ncbi:MAG: CAP domain-containing protein, partial [Nitrospiraceae bacterium]|nr:CAP domain-containing protein [Nitrospiraceae bacterium]
GEDAVARAERMGIPSYTVRGIYKIGIGENVGLRSRGRLKGYDEIRSSDDIAFVMMDIWMKSKGHRENILSSDYGLLGVGIVCDSEGTYYFTQNFR